MTGSEEYPLPKNLFLEAKDYSPRQGKVVAARRQSIAHLRLLQENLGKAIANLSVADSQGYMGYALDVVQGISEDITVAVASMAKANANAEQRYDAKLLEAAAPPPAPPGTLASAVIHIKPDVVPFAAAMQAIGRGAR